MDVLRLAPLNENGIYTIVNASKDFLVVNGIQQSVGRNILLGNIEERIAVCRELVLSKNPHMTKDYPLLDLFAGTPLDVEENPFVYVLYDQETQDYVRNQANVRRELPKALIMDSKKGTPFYLVKEKDVNNLIPLRIEIRL